MRLAVKITHRFKSLTVLLLILLNLGLLAITDFDNLLFGDIHLSSYFSRYQTLQETPTNKISRKWMAYAIDLGKRESLALTANARLYAYTATVFADVLEKTNDLDQASLATAEILNHLMPKQTIETNGFLTSIKMKVNSLSLSARNILDKYKFRSENDDYLLPEDKSVARDASWYIKQKKIDTGDRVGAWLPWTINRENNFKIPSPPASGSLTDIVELEKSAYVTKIIGGEDYDSSIFWNGGETGHDTRNVNGASWTGRKASLPGIWQNILSVEEGRGISELEYAKAQKILAQTIADSFIKTWQIKYKYWTQRPSERIVDLHQSVDTPTFPGYVSEHASISYAAAIVLTHLFHEKKDVWFFNAKESKNSRLLAGVNFDIDNQAGQDLGNQIGKTIIQNLDPSENKLTQDVPYTQTVFSRPTNLDSISKHAVINMSSLIKNTKKLVIGFTNKWFAYMPHSKFIVANDIAGLSHVPGGYNVSWVDYNNDGFIDLLITNQRLLKNNGDGTFTDTAKSSGLFDAFSTNESKAFVFGDYNNDGCPDVYLSVTGQNNRLDDIGESDKLYRNNCNGTFTDVTKNSGIKDSFHGFGAAWGDYDNDGLLDIYVANIGLEIPETAFRSMNVAYEKFYPTRLGVAYRSEPNILYHNNGDGTFTNVTKRARVIGVAKCYEGIMKMGTGLDGEELGKKTSYQPVWLDYNNDGKLDLFVATDGGVSPLYRNNGDGTFTDVTKEAGLCLSGSGMGVSVGDYDNDGNLDIYVTNTGRNYLWHNNGNGTFTEVAQRAGVADRGNGWGTDFFDYDNDGDLDLLVVNGNNPDDYKNDPRVDTSSTDSFYENLGNGTFANVSEKVGLMGNEYKKSAAHADYDNDGFTDMYVKITGREVINGGYLYKNVGNKNHWLTIELVGTKSNKNAVGARIILTSNGGSQIREITAGSSHVSQNSLWQTFGLGKNKVVDEIHIQWPSGLTQTLNKTKANQKIIIKEGQ